MEINEKEVKKYLDDAIEDIIGIMKIKSVEGTPAPGAPFGVETGKALDYALHLSEKMGFRAVWGHNNEYGYADFGTGKKLFGIICHLDVVPSGDLSKWKKSPWEPIIENGEVYGRGSLDDKGPTIINMYALKYLKDHGFEPKDWTIRIIFGLTEETTWQSINSYLKHEQKPDLAYTPDGEWPVIYAEKSIINFDLVGPGVANLTMHGGEAYNVVCDVNEVAWNRNAELAKWMDHNHHEYLTEGHKLIAKGKAAHGSIPETGVNAAINALLGVYDLEKANAPVVAKFTHDNFSNHNYELAKVFNHFSDETGKVSINMGKVRINDKEQRICFDGRMPVSYKKEDIIADIEKFIKAYPGLKLELQDWEHAKYVAPNSAIITQMMDIYREVTGEHDAKPLAIGGGTYARAMDNCIAFGACRSMDLMHNVNERISIKELDDMLKIYIRAIKALVS